MDGLNFRKLLKNRLKTRKNPLYCKWFDKYKRQKGHTKHHPLGRKYNDLHLVSEPIETHDHSIAETEEQFIDRFLESQENLYDYIEFLQEKLYGAK